MISMGTSASDGSVTKLTVPKLRPCDDAMGLGVGEVVPSDTNARVVNSVPDAVGESVISLSVGVSVTVVGDGVDGSNVSSGSGLGMGTLPPPLGFVNDGFPLSLLGFAKEGLLLPKTSASAGLDVSTSSTDGLGVVAPKDGAGVGFDLQSLVQMDCSLQYPSSGPQNPC